MTKSELERLLAERFPRPDVPASVRAITAPVPVPTSDQHAPGRVGEMQLVAAQQPDSSGHAPERVEATAAAPGLPAPFAPAPFAPPPAPERSRVQPLAPGRYGVQFTMGQSVHDKLRYAQDLLGHRVAPDDLATVFEQALDALIPELEQRRFAATTKPRPGRPRSSENPRNVPARVKRAVWKRDQGRCTFESDDGKRCEAREDLQFDHVREVGRGGELSDGIRLRCPAHNQHTAELAFGAEFMRHKRIAAAEARAAKRA
jgi:hypothetical protein